jgi:hypothetical protein
MPASRWNSNVLDLLALFDQDELALEELLFKPIIPQVVQNNKETDKEIDNQSEETIRKSRRFCRYCL